MLINNDYFNIDDNWLNAVYRREPNLKKAGISKKMIMHSCLDDTDSTQVLMCVVWICKHINTKPFRYSSYTLKHCAERYYKSYISNGCFMAATILLDLPYRNAGERSLNIFIKKVALTTKETLKRTAARLEPLLLQVNPERN